MTTYIYEDTPGSFNSQLLMEELVAALAETPYLIGFPDGSRVDVTVDTASQEDVDTVIAAHNPATLSYNEQINLVEATADNHASSIPGWSTWTEDEALAWLEANVAPEIETTAPKTYQALKAMARMSIAVRNKTWPQLEGS